MSPFTFAALIVALVALLQVAPATAQSDMILDITATVVNATVCLPMSGIKLTIDWGDGTSANYSATSFVCSQSNSGVTHMYSSPGNYTIKLSPWLATSPWLQKFGRPFSTNLWVSQQPRIQLTAVRSFGALGIQDLTYAFGGSSYLVAVPPQLPATVTSIKGIFSTTAIFNSYNVSSWSFPLVTSLEGVFLQAYKFNQSLNSWNVGNIKSFVQLFYNALEFNQPIGSWNMSSATTISNIFIGSRAFNQPIDSWDVSSVTDMSSAFSSALLFNQSLASWNTGKVKNMNSMFIGASVFNQPLGSWNTSAVTDMGSMFAQADAFNQSIGSWDVSNVRTMNYMLRDMNKFNQPLASWNTSRVTDMSGLFQGALVFNRPIDTWNVSQVSNFGSMFLGAPVFNQPLASWNTTSATNMNVRTIFIQLAFRPSLLTHCCVLFV
jgi:surface protein